MEKGGLGQYEFIGRFDTTAIRSIGMISIFGVSAGDFAR